VAEQLGRPGWFKGLDAIVGIPMFCVWGAAALWYYYPANFGTGYVPSAGHILEVAVDGVAAAACAVFVIHAWPRVRSLKEEEGPPGLLLALLLIVPAGLLVTATAMLHTLLGS
jgi:hypothetical protein